LGFGLVGTRMSEPVFLATRILEPSGLYCRRGRVCSWAGSDQVNVRRVDRHFLDKRPPCRLFGWASNADRPGSRLARSPCCSAD
jgi:hypothetical protein